MKSLIINTIGLNEFSFYLPCLYSKIVSFCTNFLIGTYSIMYPKSSFVKTTTVTTCKKYVAWLRTSSTYVYEITLYVPSTTTQSAVTNALNGITINGLKITTVTVSSFKTINLI